MMDCRQVRENIGDYEAGRLPELTARRLEQHMDTCEQCNGQFSFPNDHWVEAAPKVPNDFSVVDNVMSRILKENKWALPINSQVARLSETTKRFGIAIALVMLIIFIFSAVTSPLQVAEQPASSEEWTALNAVQTITSAQTVNSQGEMLVASDAEISDGIVASLIDPIIYSGTFNNTSPEVNFLFAASLLGILITVTYINWLSRS